MKVGSDKGYLRLRFSYAGKRYALTLGLPDTKVNRVFAQQKAAQIELDIISGNFDPKLEKYKPQRAKPEKTVLGSVHAWFAQFAQEQIKDKGLNKGSVHRYSATQKHLEKFFKEKSVNAIDETAARGFVDYLKKKVTTRTAKDYLILVQAFWKWGMDKQGLKQNPWSTLVAGVKPPRKQKVRPFTVAEVQAILAAFRGDRYYNHYADFVTFLFGTGCRFGEAVALKWKHIADDCKSAWIGESVSRGIRKTTKTGKDRTINLTPKIMAMLLDRKPNPCDPEALVFPAPKGSHISDHTFRRRAWKTILAHLEIQYRKPYATRHTAISQALANGANPLAVAEETGHDPETLFKWYASVIAPQAVMVEF
ncbi:MAG: tyrosine-type recombinase/integrase [Oculatellaceae cyanobacterium Prado106]|nr:tyrosine-type recombinase/integrase [Oculatellaceae cyanobacterium Prado106]